MRELQWLQYSKSVFNCAIWNVFNWCLIVQFGVQLLQIGVKLQIENRCLIIANQCLIVQFVMAVPNPVTCIAS